MIAMYTQPHHLFSCNRHYKYHSSLHLEVLVTLPGDTPVSQKLGYLCVNCNHHSNNLQHAALQDQFILLHLRIYVLNKYALFLQ